MMAPSVHQVRDEARNKFRSDNQESGPVERADWFRSSYSR